VAVAWLLLSAGPVAVYRFVDPTVTMVMALEPGPLSEIEHEWIDRGAIAPAMVRAVIASEDQRFLQHHGIDMDAVEKAVDDYLQGDALRGASTITQQVAKNVFLWNGRSWVRKALEAWFAILIDAAWSKQRILEVYLNAAEFGPGIFGVEAAAKHFYAIPAAEISASQAALLAAVLPSPKRLDAGNPSGYLAMRQAEILKQMSLLQQRGYYAGLDW
jgi:monofunctional biosynthetic peptidoglycan transglycosylase